MPSKPRKAPFQHGDRKALIAKVHIARKDLGLDDDTYRALLEEVTGKTSCADMSDRELRAVVDHCAARGFQKKSAGRKKKAGEYPGRPANIDAGDRAAQLQKIEALLTIGGLSWAYADAIAKNMKLADKVQWVPSEKLHYIITALRKKAQKEGWDLSGEKK